MHIKLLITGISGLIGSSLAKKLQLQNSRIKIAGLDLQARNKNQFGDTRDYIQVAQAMRECDGVIHLAALSRVIWAENDPLTCWQSNVTGTRNILKAATESRKKPWVIFASSREVYGQQDKFPVPEHTGLKPMNVYGHAKVVGEQETFYARTLGVRTAIVRFSNVYGSPADHTTRVIPAFCRAALNNSPLRIEGEDHVFDFTYVDDVVEGIMTLIQLMTTEKKLKIPPVHFVGGCGTTLLELSQLVCKLAQSSSKLEPNPPRNFDVESFIGDPKFAEKLLGWTASTSLEKGLLNLMDLLKSEQFHREQAA